ncbi:ATP-binding protein [Streptomyces sp. NPDC058611]|uniref:ATP-binding protein n=1 Tax=unclassified Streptomyces TaxID=2593676 RepID=UPI00366297B1
MLLFANSDTFRVVLEAESQGGGMYMRLSRQQRFPRVRSAVPAARHFVGDTLAGWGIVERRDDVRLCASGLAANAVVHGVPVGRQFSVQLVWEVRDLWIEVRDSGPGCPVVQRPGWEASAGRGLWLVTSVADAFEVRDEGVGKSARAVFRLPPHVVDGRVVPGR